MSIYKSDEYEIKKSISKTLGHVEKYTRLKDKNLIEKCLISNIVFDKKLLKDELNKFREFENKEVKIKIDKAKKIAGIICKNSNILFVGVTGSVAIGQPKKNDDIDLLIICKKDTLWKTRFLMRLYFFYKQIPHRKYKSKEYKDEFCFNLWLDENSLLIPKKKQELRNSIDLVNIVPLVNKDSVYERFLYENKEWVKKYSANQLYDLKVAKIENIKKNRKIFKIIINYFWYFPQKIYIMFKNKKNFVTANQAFFHDE